VRDEGGSGRIPVDIVVDADGASLRSTIAGLRQERVVVAADLSLGAWRGHHVARELCAQLAVPAPDGVEEPGLRRGRVPVEGATYADLTARAVDIEAGDDPHVSAAAAAAARITEVIHRRGPHVVLIVAPRFGLSWEDEDVLLLRFLKSALERDEMKIVVLVASDAQALPHWFQVHDLAPAGLAAAQTDEPTQVPEGSLAPTTIPALVPGLIEPQLHDLLGAALPSAEGILVPLVDGFHLVAPEFRRPPAAVAQHEYDWLAIVARPFPWLAAYAQCFSADELVDPTLLHMEAHRRWSEGAAAVALRLADRAAECARTTPEQDQLRCWADGIRIALQRFDELADAPDPPDDAAPVARGFFHEAKGWGLVMSGRAAQAGPHLQQAEKLLSPHAGSREYLYLLNISALGALRSGDFDRAFELEETIAEGAARLDPRDWSLEYLNALNLARLRKYRGDLGGARSAYRRAFDVTSGTRSDSELVYANLLLGRGGAASGRRDDAFMGALRASMHWLASRVPEALGSRTLAAILNEQWPLGSRPMLGEVATALLAQLTDAALASDRPPVVAAVRRDVREPVPAFVRNGLPTDVDAERLAAGSHGVGFIATEARSPQRRAEHVEQLQLGALVRSLLDVLCPAAGVDTAGTIVVDDNFGREVPVSASELLGLCIRFSAHRMVFAERVMELDDDRRWHIERASEVRLGPAVARIEGTGATRRTIFKRVLPPRPLRAREDLVLDRVGERPSIAQLASRSRGAVDDVVRLVRSLEADRVVTVHVSRRSCAEVGIEMSQ
jgi:tetratricopeptide (TPR) repeat protein